MRTSGGQAGAQGRQNTHVWVAVDGSSAALAALPVARRLTERLDAELSLLHVIDPETSRELLGISLADIRTHLNLESAALAGISLSLQYDEPSAGIVRMGADPTTALVVMVSHGGEHMVKGGEAGRMGHVAEAVLARATRPLVMVRPEAELARGAIGQSPTDRDRMPPLRRLLVPLDGTPATARGIQTILPLASRCGAELDLLFVVAAGLAGPMEPGSIAVPAYVDHAVLAWPTWTHDVLAWVEAHRVMASSSTPSATVPMRVSLTLGAMGDIGTAIIREAAARQVDALVLVRTSRLEPGHGGILRHVLAHAPCPVVLTMA